MASVKSSVDILFREHSFEEIASVRDNLATEIDKRTELLKSIVKEKYRDVVDTSDAIQSMKLNLNKVEHSIRQLDLSISNFYNRIREPHSTRRTTTEVYQSKQQTVNTSAEEDQAESNLKDLLSATTSIWDSFDSGNLKETVRTYNEAKQLLERCQIRTTSEESRSIIKGIESNLQRSGSIIKNQIWHRIQTAESNQIGVIVQDEDNDLYRLSLQSSMENLVRKLKSDILDTSFQAQIRRYQQYSYFSTVSNSVDETISDMNPPATGCIQIPKEISPELSGYLFNICRVINTIAGFSLVRSSIIESLRMTMIGTIEVYEELLKSVETMGGGSRRRRALQLYFDLMYVRVLLNTSKNLELIEELDPRISQLMSNYEGVLDSIELYIVSDAMHTNVLNLIKSTVRLYGLLVPYLQ